MSKDDGDFLGYGVYADTLWARIARALNKDTAGGKLGDDPLVVGIFGEWGSGKSKLLSMVMQRAVAERDERISVHTHDGYAPLTIPVFFQPWKYEHEKHLLVPMLLHIVLALEDCLRRAKTLDDALVGTVRRGIDGALQQIGGVVKATKTVLGVVEPGSAAALGTAQALADTIKPGTPRKQVRDFTWREDGRAYYELHDILRKVTRPGKYAEVTGGAYQDKDFGCSFVIFIDDLDRCLPEKAVEALELIKTVFNLESFAFVLALDEEVVERGIGHRYKDYALQNKKPEMPITGFEYLEKIVHLPFRLPALTREQAAKFVRDYEERVAQPDANLRWFAPKMAVVDADGSPADGQIKPLGATFLRSDRIDLLDLALEGFDVYVPRKLVRLVELMHTVASIARERGQPLTWQSGGKVDVRVVLALLMVQLFQPEMYRLMRQRIGAFPALLSALSGGAVGADGVSADRATLSGANVSDVDLLAWVGHGSALPASTEGDATAAAGQVHDTIARIQKIGDPSLRSLAQQVRWPVVTQIIEYRSAQRHGFDLLKLVQALAQSLQATGEDPRALNFLPYLSLLSQPDEAPPTSQSPPSPAGAGMAMAATATGFMDPRPRFSPRDRAGLYYDWQSPEPSVQANIAGQRELPQGQVLDTETAQVLLAMANDALAATGGDEQRRLRKRLAAGLVHLAPFISRANGPAYWAALGSDLQAGDELGHPLADLKALAHRERWMDVRSTLGADPRWDASRWHLPKERLAGHDAQVEPIPGFVRVPAGSFSLGADDRGDNKSRTVRIASDFFIARHLTTVDQFAAFIAARGYENDDWWDSQGTAWRKCEWASKTNDENLRKWLDERTLEQRQEPMLWAEQQAHGSRPVWGVNWFEARAYARWLSAQLAQDFGRAKLPGYQACLPTESQWERAARAATLHTADKRLWPWGDDNKVAPLRANLHDSKIGRASVVGLFEANPLGLADLAGNLREWQDNLYESKDPYKAWERIPKIAGQTSGGQEPPDWLLTEEDRQKSALPALRGGSWDGTSFSARASFRFRRLPDGWDYNIGFRLVLSLAEKDSEN